MKFESKYLIRWGIPGWLFIFWLVYNVIYVRKVYLPDITFPDLSKGLSFIISLLALGVIIGYVIHQIYFAYVWVMGQFRNHDNFANDVGEKFPKHDGWGTDKNDDYFQLEYVWHSMLLNLDESKRKYLEDRYRHLLGTVHSLGALLMSSGLSLYVTGFIIFSYRSEFTYNAYFLTGLCIQLIVFVFSIVNYRYYSRNLDSFQIKMLKTYL